MHLMFHQEISTYFPRKVLWRAFLCSLFAAIVLKALNPNGTGKLVLFETNYGIDYDPIHYLVFVFLGLAGGLFGGVFCKANFMWSKSFRKYSIISNHPVFELSLVVLVTALLQYPNPLTREPGDIIIKNLLVDCVSTSEDSILNSSRPVPDLYSCIWQAKSSDMHVSVPAKPFFRHSPCLHKAQLTRFLPAASFRIMGLCTGSPRGQE